MKDKEEEEEDGNGKRLSILTNYLLIDYICHIRWNNGGVTRWRKPKPTVRKNSRFSNRERSNYS